MLGGADGPLAVLPFIPSDADHPQDRAILVRVVQVERAANAGTVFLSPRGGLLEDADGFHLDTTVAHVSGKHRSIIPSGAGRG